MTSSINIYYNIYDRNNTYFTDYSNLINYKKLNNFMFIYTANQYNSGPGNNKHSGLGTAIISDNPRSFGIITGFINDSNSGFNDNKHHVIYKHPNYYNKTFGTIKEHIDIQVNMLDSYIKHYNFINPSSKIDNIIIPLEKNNNKLKLGVFLFKHHKDIDKIGSYWLLTLLKKFNKNIKDLKPLLSLVDNSFLEN